MADSIFGAVAGPAGPAGATGGSGPGVLSDANPYFSCFSQGGTGGTIPLVDGGTGADGWIQSSETPAADLVERVNGSALGSSTNTHFKISKGGAAGKLLVVNFFNVDNSKAWDGQDMAFAIDIAQPDGVGGAIDANLAIFAVSGLAANAVPRPLVAAWNADGVDPTFDAAITLIANLTVTPGIGAFGTFIIAASIPFGTFDNLGVGVYSEDQVPVGGSLSLSRALPLPSGASLVYPQLPQTGISISGCEQYIEKSYNPSDAPGTATDEGAVAAVGGQLHSIRYRTPKNFDPDMGPGTNPENGITLFSPVTGAAGMWRDVTAGADVAAAVNDAGVNGFSVTNGGGAGNEVRGHWVANAAL